MSRLGEFALRYAALRAMGTKRLQAAKQAAREVRDEAQVRTGECPACGAYLSLYGGGTSGVTRNGVDTPLRSHFHKRCVRCARSYTYSAPAGR